MGPVLFSFSSPEPLPESQSKESAAIDQIPSVRCSCLKQQTPIVVFPTAVGSVVDAIGDQSVRGRCNYLHKPADHLRC